MTYRSPTPIALEVPAPRGPSVRADERRVADRRAAHRGPSGVEAEVAVAVALARSAELACFDDLYRRDFHLAMWLTIATMAVYAYDVLLLTGQLTVR